MGRCTDSLAGDPRRLLRELLRRDTAADRPRIAELKQNPYPQDADYDTTYDNWTTTFGNGSGIITYAVVEQHRCILILRLLSL